MLLAVLKAYLPSSSEVAVYKVPFLSKALIVTFGIPFISPASCTPFALLSKYVIPPKLVPVHDIGAHATGALTLTVPEVAEAPLLKTATNECGLPSALISKATTCGETIGPATVDPLPGS